MQVNALHQASLAARGTEGKLESAGGAVSFGAAAYVSHLVFPALLLLDILHAYRLRMTVGSDLILGGCAALWLVVGTLAYSFSRNRQRFLQRTAGPLLSFYAVLFILGLFEVGLVLARRQQAPAIWQPGSRLVFYPDRNSFPGVSSVSHFRANEFGLRGPSLPVGKDVYKIIAVGGSTTLCLMLDDQKTWPQQLMNEMNQQQGRHQVWVSNAGVNGHTAVHHLMMLRSIPFLSQADALILMVGMNDLQFTLSHEGMPTQQLLEHGAAQFREEMTTASYSPYPLYRRLRLFGVSRRAYDLAFERINDKNEKETINEKQLRQLRDTTAPISEPDVSVGLAEYRKRLGDLADECHRRAVRCVFVTQPSLWRADLSTDAQQLLLFGWVGPPFEPKGHVSMLDLKNALDVYNHAMLEACMHSKIECLDLASEVPKDPSVFYDDVHFTERGAGLVADRVATYLLSLPPFAPQNASAAVTDTVH